MKLIFFGTGKFALPALEELLKSRHQMLAVVTQPDTKKGRGWAVVPTPVKALVKRISPKTPILQPEKRPQEEFTHSLKRFEADIFVVIDYGRILKKEFLSLPRKYCVNLHPSRLPKYRGASPVNWTILNGEKETGITVFKMDERMDAGSIIMQESTRIGEKEDAESLLERLALSGAELLLKALEKIEAGREEFRQQNEAEASYAPKLEKKQGEIDWTKPAALIERLVRGMQPWPGAFTYIDGKMLKILEARVVNAKKSDIPAGRIYDEVTLTIATGEGAIRIKRLQLEGKKVMAPDKFLRGYRVKEGTVLGK